MFEQTFKNIDDILHKDAGCSSELDYVEQTSWVLFLKYLDDFERDRRTKAELAGKTYEDLISKQRKVKIKIKLGNGKEFQIQHAVATTFIGPDGKPMTVQEFLNSLYGKLPAFFKSEDELRRIWSNPFTRKTLLDKLAEAGFGKDELATLQKVIDAEKSDLFDVLEFIAYSAKLITREVRVASAQKNIFAMLEPNQKEFLEFVLSKYIETGVEELDQEKLPGLLELKYHAVSDGAEKLGGVPKIRELFIEFQKHLYSEKIA